MARFQKKPEQIDAWLWDETKETFRVLAEAGMHWTRYESHIDEDYVRNLRIITSEGPMYVEKGDWIIKGARVEFYTCKPDAFEASYEEIQVASAE